MSADNTPRKRPGYRRATLYPASLRITMTAEMRDALDAAASKAGWSAGETARQCISRGLPGLRASLRPSKRPDGRPD